MLVAAYQAEATVARAVASALAQTYPPAEVIVCDDGSEDALEMALAPFRHRIVLLRQDNRGAAAARNTALAAASGDFVVILDADDAYHPERLEALAELAELRPDLDLITTDAFLVVDGRRVGRFYDRRPFEVLDQRGEILRWCFLGGWPAVRRERLVEAGGFDAAISRAHDWDCWMRLIYRGCRAGLVDEPLMEYTLHGGGLTAERVTSLEERVAVLERNVPRLTLTRHERKVLARSLRIHRSRAAAARAAEDLCGVETAEARRRLARLARKRELPLRLRLRVAAAYLQPSRAEKWLPEATPHSTRLAQRR